MIPARAPIPLHPAGGIEPGRTSLAARLDFYRVHHLIHRLRPYEATSKPSMMQRASWQTLLYWQRLMDTTELELDLREIVKV